MNGSKGVNLVAPGEASRRLGGSTAMAWMLAGLALVAVLVVARDARHELLGCGTGSVADLLLEIVGIVAAQRGCQPATMKDLDLTALANTNGEA
jgi:hypothetical protein